MGYTITTLVENCVYGRKLQAEHGLSLYIETSEHRLLFDTGASDLFIRNARLLHIDLQKVDYLILSHGHSDHTGGLRHFLELNKQATVVCKREAFSPKFKDERPNCFPAYFSFPLLILSTMRIPISNAFGFRKKTVAIYRILFRMNWR